MNKLHVCLYVSTFTYIEKEDKIQHNNPAVFFSFLNYSYFCPIIQPVRSAKAKDYQARRKVKEKASRHRRHFKIFYGLTRWQRNYV